MDHSPQTSSLATPPSWDAETRRFWIRRLGFLLLPVVLIIAAIAYIAGGQTVSTDNAYVEADKVGISTDIAGTVKEIAVTDNQHVQAGQLLYRLEDQSFQHALAQADGQLGMVRNDLIAMKAKYRMVQADLKEAQDNVNYYNGEMRRQQDLLNAHVASESAFAMARRNVETAQQKVSSLEQQLAATAASLNGDPNIDVEKLPRYQEALAQRQEAARQLDHTVVKAPFAGIVTNVNSIAPGKYLPAATTAFFLVDMDHLWVDANPKETQLTYVRTGQTVTVTVDTYPGEEWQGTVESISPAATQEFSLLPAQNTSGNWVKVVQRIPMRVRLDTSDAKRPPLRVGMSAVIDINTGHRRGLPNFITSLFGGGRSSS